MSVRTVTRTLATLAIVGAITLGTLLYFWTPTMPADTHFVVHPGDTGRDIARGLADAGFVRSLFLFRFSLDQSHRATALRPGTYDLAGVHTYDDIIAILTGGVPEQELTLRIIEGWSLRDIATELIRLGLIKTPADLYDLTGEPARIYSGLDKVPDYSKTYTLLADKPSRVSMEGYLFPDTYRFALDATPQDVVNELLQNFQYRLNSDVLAKIATSKHTLFETLTMASILEREVKSDQDRQIVADIFWRRLAKGMPLQADSTVNYVTGGGSPAIDAAGSAIDSPYNTYQHKGLPPGPICNPGLAAISAAANPAPNKYWYFLTDKDGNVHYATTFEEQIRNKQLYLR